MAQCNIDTLMESGHCFVCLPTKTQNAIQIALLKEIAGNTQTVDELVDAASEFVRLTEKEQIAIQNQLLCEISVP